MCIDSNQMQRTLCRAEGVMVALCVLFVGCGDDVRFRPRKFFDDKLVVEMTEAAQRGDTQAIDTSIAQGADVNAIGEHGATPLMLTLRENKLGYKHLLKSGANPNIQEELGRSVVSLAALESDSEWLKEALAHGGDPNILNAKEMGKSTPLFCTISVGNFDNAKALIASGANLDSANRSGAQPLVYAAAQHHWDIVCLLLEEGANYRAIVPGNYSGDRTSIAEYILGMEREYVERFESEQLPWYDKAVKFLKAEGIDVDKEKRD